MDVSGDLLALFQRDTLKAFCFLMSEVAQERWEEGGDSDVHMSAFNSGYVVDGFQLTMQSVLKCKIYTNCNGRYVKRTQSMFYATVLEAIGY